MKKVILLSVIFIGLTTFAQGWFGKEIKGNGNLVHKTRNVGNYDEIVVAGSFDVNLVSGTEGKLDIKIEDNLLAYLITEVDNGKLKIRWKKGVNINTHKGIFIEVPFKKIDGVSLKGSGDITSEDTIKSSEFNVSLAGSGDITLSINAENTTSKVMGSGNITIEGESDYLEVLVTGSGGFHGFGFDTNDVDAKVTGSGDIEIFVDEKLTGTIIGSGDIDYKGNPEIEKTKIVGSGDISKK